MIASWKPWVASSALALLLASGSAWPFASQEGSREFQRAWPEPPAPARIHYSGVLTPQLSRAAPSAFGRVWRAVVGSQELPGMQQPYGLAVSRDQHLYVADTVGGAIHVYDLRQRGYRRLTVPAESLVGIATRGDRIYVTDSVGARVRCLDSRGRVQWSTGPDAGLLRPTGIVATLDRLFVLDTLAGQIVELGVGGAVVKRFGKRGDATGQFNFPSSITADGQNHLYVTDTLNFRVQIFTTDGEFVGSFGRIGDGSGDLNRPKGIAVDRDGNIHVVEGLHDVVQVFDRTGRFLLAYGESGTGPGQLWLPTGITIAENTVYVSDAANRRVQIYRYVGERQ